MHHWSLHWISIGQSKSLSIEIYIHTDPKKVYYIHTYPDFNEKSLQISPRNADDNFLLKIGSEPQTSIHEHFN